MVSFNSIIRFIFAVEADYALYKAGLKFLDIIFKVTLGLTGFSTQQNIFLQYECVLYYPEAFHTKKGYYLFLLVQIYQNMTRKGQ
jgi:hypothetical protein